MAKFRVDFAGSNCLRVMGEVPMKHGFYTTRFVETLSVDQAKTDALGLVSKELDGMLANAAGDPPVFEIEEAYEIESFPNVALPGRGFVWYPEDEPQ